MTVAYMKMATPNGPSEPLEGILFAAIIHSRIENFFIDWRHTGRGENKIYVLSHFKTGCAMGKKYHGVDFDYLCTSTRKLFPTQAGLIALGQYTVSVLETRITADTLESALNNYPQINELGGF